MFYDMSLRQRLVLMTFLSVLVPLLLAGTYFCVHQLRSIYQSNAEYLYESSKTIASDLDNWVLSQRKTIYALANSSTIRQACATIVDEDSSSEEKEEAQLKLRLYLQLTETILPYVMEINLAYCGTLPQLLTKYQDSDQNYTSASFTRKVAPDILEHMRRQHLELGRYQGGTIFFSTDPDYRLKTAWLPQDLTKTNPLRVMALLEGKPVVFQRNKISTEFPDLQYPDELVIRHSSTTSTLATIVYKEDPTPETVQVPFDPSLRDTRTPLAIMTLRLAPGNIQRTFSYDNYYVVDTSGRLVTVPRSMAKELADELGPRSRGHQALHNMDHLYTLYLYTPKEGVPTRPYQEYKNYLRRQTQSAQAPPRGPDPVYKLSTPYTDFLGYRVIGAWAPCKELDMFVVSEIHQSQLLASWRRSLWVSISIVFLIGGLFVILAYWTARNISEPIIRLNVAAQRLAGGDRSTRCHINRRDEIGQLAQAFDTMATRIEDTVKALEKARDEAIEAYQFKSRFLANMSHELRTPLNAIIGYSEMMIEEAQEEGHLPDDSLQDLRSIHLAGLNLLGIINDILNISKVESGKIDLFIEHFPLAELLVEVQAAINSLAQANEDAFAIEDQTEALLLHSDHAKLRQILINLLGNAVKFTRGGKVTLRIELISGQQAEMPSTWPSLEGKAQVISYIPFSPHNQVVSFMVADTGIGMTPEQSAKIFEEFTQADGSISRTYGGTGLGLALVRYFSQLLYGRLELLTQAEKGSLFVLKIPLRWPVSEEQPSSPPPLPLTKSAPDAQP